MAKPRKAGLVNTGKARNHRPPSTTKGASKEGLFKPKAQHRAALAYRIENPQAGKAEIAEAVGYTQAGVYSWFQNLAFLKWWNQELMQFAKYCKGETFLQLLGLMNDSEVEPRDKVQAARVLLAELPSEVAATGSAVRELFDAAEALPEGAQVRAAIKDGQGNQALVQIVNKSAAQRDVDELVQQGRDLGVTDSADPRSMERASGHALAEVASRYVSDEEGGPPPDTDTETGGTVSPSLDREGSSQSGIVADASGVPGGVGGPKSRQKAPPSVPAPLLRTIWSREGGGSPPSSSSSSPPELALGPCVRTNGGLGPFLVGRCPLCHGEVKRSSDGRVWHCEPCGERWLAKEKVDVVGHCPECGQRDLREAEGSLVECFSLSGACGWRGMAELVDWRDRESGKGLRLGDVDASVTPSVVVCPACYVTSFATAVSLAVCCSCGMRWDHTRDREGWKRKSVDGPPFANCVHGRRAMEGCAQCHRNRMDGVMSGEHPSHRLGVTEGIGGSVMAAPLMDRIRILEELAEE